MQINRTSWLYRWAYFFAPAWYRTNQVNLCPFFWRVVLVVPLIWLTILGTLSLILFALFIIPVQVLGWEGLLIAPSILVAASFILRSISKIQERYLRSQPKVFREPNILVEYIKAKKAKFCPRIDIVD